MANKYGFRSGKGTFKTLETRGAQFIKSVGKTAAYSTNSEDYIVGVDTTGGAVTITLSVSDNTDGRVIIVNDIANNAGTASITIATEGSEKIDGADTIVLSTDDLSYTMYSDGSNWYSF